MYTIFTNLLDYAGTSDSITNLVILTIAGLFCVFAFTWLWEFITNIIYSIFGKRRK